MGLGGAQAPAPMGDSPPPVQPTQSCRKMVLYTVAHWKRMEKNETPKKESMRCAAGTVALVSRKHCFVSFVLFISRVNNSFNV